MNRLLIIVALTFLNPIAGNSQLTTFDAIPNGLVEVLGGWGMVTYDASFTGAVGHFTSFNTPFESDYGIEVGAILTTGTIYDIAGAGPHGPNNMESAGYDAGLPGDLLITNLLGGVETYDAATLTFNVIAISDTIQLSYIFGSEEYDEYIGSQFTDAMGIFISGPSIPGMLNIAKLPNGSFVTVNNVHSSGVNPFGNYSAINGGSYLSNTGTSASAPHLQYDGLTVPLTAVAAVVPGEHYTITVVVADAGDHVYDSGVFLIGRSLVAENEEATLSSLSIHPNPTSEILNIEMSSIKSYDYSIISSDGKIVQEGILTSTINVESLIDGKYYLAIHSETPIVRVFQKQ
ncbi:MAG: choice-of-anchor L domain-containing protein [Crocinitomicaceae bacterium]|nr:choice-of-anchor L domain-containing protein [Crocinitomicaceae bacterium]